VLTWLKEQGIHTSITTLKRRLQIWGIREHTEVEISDALAERVNWLFHHTLYDDSQTQPSYETSTDGGSI
jgi:hemerythrin